MYLGYCAALVKFALNEVNCRLLSTVVEVNVAETGTDPVPLPLAGDTGVGGTATRRPLSPLIYISFTGVFLGIT